MPPSDEETRAFLAHDDYLQPFRTTHHHEHHNRPWRARLRTIYYYGRAVACGVQRRLPARRTRRCTVSSTITWIKYCIAAFFAFVVAHAVLNPSYLHPPPHYASLAKACETFACSGSNSGACTGCANPLSEKVFICATLYDPTGELAGGAWGETLLTLIDYLDPANVFLSIYANDGGEAGTRALETLQSKITCRNSVVNDLHVPLDGFPTVRLPDGQDRIKRTVYLSEMRNRAFRPLETLDEDALGTKKFDKILFLNDVLFKPIDAAHLLFSTNHDGTDRSKYLAACAIDYYWDPIMMYDLYAQRDAEGYRNGEPVFPYFSAAGRGLSRTAMLQQSDAVPVKSCWGGMVAIQAEYVQRGSRTLSQKNTLSNFVNHAIDPDAPRNITAPVRFRGESEVFVDACECCLFMADVAQVAASEGASEQRIFVNPYIRVAYYPRLLRLLSWPRPWERLLNWPQRVLTWWKNKPKPNPYREVQQGQTFVEEIWKQDENGNGNWELAKRVGRSGLFCAIRNMQVIRPRPAGTGKNWENIAAPEGQSFEFGGV